MPCYHCLVATTSRNVWQKHPHGNQSAPTVDLHSLWCNTPRTKTNSQLTAGQLSANTFMTNKLSMLVDCLCMQFPLPFVYVPLESKCQNYTDLWDFRLSWWWLRRWLVMSHHPTNWCSKHLWNINELPPDHTAQQPGRHPTSCWFSYQNSS